LRAHFYNLHVHFFLGTEYTSLQDFFKKQKILLYHTNSGLKSVKAECYIRVICSRLYRILAGLNTFNWVDQIVNVVDHYNSMTQRKLNGFSPLEIVTDAKKAFKLKIYYENEAQKYRDKLEKKKKKNKSKFLIGDTVRYLKKGDIFTKFYIPQYSQDIEKITKIINSNPPMYYISNNPSRSFYEQELQKVISPDLKKSHLYIDDFSTLAHRQTRSGKTLSSNDKIFLLKSTLNPKFKKYITEKEKKKLMDDGVLLSDLN